ncbi:hypothetical protein GGI43DRAFT_429818 [Trichoderma evansii]
MDDSYDSSKSENTKVHTRPSSEYQDDRKRRREQNRIAQRRYREKMAEKAKQTEKLAEQAKEFWHNLLEAGHSKFVECHNCQRLRQLSQLPSVEFTTPLHTNPCVTSTDNATKPHYIAPPSASSRTPGVIDIDPMLLDFHETSHIVSGSAETVNEDSTHMGMKPVTTVNEYPVSVHDETGTEWNSAVQLSDQASFLPDLYEPENDIMDPTEENVQDDTMPKVITRHKNTLSQLDASLHAAASKGNKAIVSILLRNGSRVDTKDGLGRTPLRLCAENGHLEVFKLLMDKGADATSTDYEGTSILLAAVRAEREEIVEVLAACLQTK